MAESEGISIRFIRQFDIKTVRAERHDAFANPMHAALMLAGQDDRDLPFSQKLADATAFVKQKLAESNHG